MPRAVLDDERVAQSDAGGCSAVGSAAVTQQLTNTGKLLLKARDIVPDAAMAPP